MVSHIPRGKVASYSQIARLLGAPGAARLVGFALHSLPNDSRVPWQRVINAQGGLSLRKLGEAGELQHCLLETEGIIFDERERVDWERFGWWGDE